MHSPKWDLGLFCVLNRIWFGHPERGDIASRGIGVNGRTAHGWPDGRPENMSLSSPTVGGVVKDKYAYRLRTCFHWFAIHSYLFIIRVVVLLVCITGRRFCNQHINPGETSEQVTPYFL